MLRILFYLLITLLLIYLFISSIHLERFVENEQKVENKDEKNSEKKEGDNSVESSIKGLLTNNPTIFPFVLSVAYTADRVKDAAARLVDKAEMTEKINVAATTIVNGVNGVVDYINGVPQKVYNRCSDMSKQIGTKIKEYGETMKPYGRTDDDEEGLKVVMMNRRHKLFLDTLYKNDKKTYTVLVKYGDEMYQTDFSKQEEVVKRLLIDLAKTNKQLYNAIAAKANT